MRCLVVVVAFFTVFLFSLADDLLPADDPSEELLSADIFNSGNVDIASGNADLFSDIVSPNLGDSSLFSSDAIVIADTGLDPSLASACDSNLSPSRVRARDGQVCLKKEPVKDWFKFPNFLRTSEPEPEDEQHMGEQQFGRTRYGNEIRCPPPFIFNLCCDGDLDGHITDVFDIGPPTVWYRVEDCYASMPLQLLSQLEDFGINC